MADNQDSVRAFIAVEIDESVRANTIQLMENLQKGIRHTGAHPKWVASENLHITLFFLGQTRLAMIERLKDAMAGAATGQKPFIAQFQGLGVFPNPKRPSVLWLGVDQGRRLLKELQGEVVRSLMPLGWEPDRKPFHPHLTLARLRSPKGAQAMMKVVESHRKIDCGSCPINRIVLFKSDLRSGGPIYTELGSWSLAEA